MALVRTRRELACVFNRCTAARRTTPRYTDNAMKDIFELIERVFGATSLKMVAAGVELPRLLRRTFPRRGPVASWTMLRG
jgi:hypothetical protein